VLQRAEQGPPPGPETDNQIFLTNFAHGVLFQRCVYKAKKHYFALHGYTDQFYLVTTGF
jgi:hypothetical protein